MLIELNIKDFAIIDELSLNFSSGFTVITGETGAGKSILIDAVDLVLGGQSDRDFVRSGAQKASVEAVFSVPTVLRTEIQSLLDSEEIEYESLDEIRLSREVRSTGRSTGRVNESVCKLAVYREIGNLLLDIHGQSENQKLLQPRHHIYLLDSFAGLDETREALKTLVRRLYKVRKDIEALEQDEAALARRIDVLEYQIQEIESAKLQTGEDETLKEESERLANSERLLEHAKQIEYLLVESDMEHAGAVEQISQVAILVSKLAKLDPSMNDLVELAESLSVQAEELADTVTRYGEDIDISPARVNEVEERLAAITSLKRKYGGSIEGVLAFAEKARSELANINNSEERLEELRKIEDNMLRQIGEMGLSLSKNRRAAAQRLSKLIEEQLKSLRMEAARFAVSIEQHEDPEGAYVEDGMRVSFNQTGIDDVNFMLSTNFGEPLKPLAKVASGGETSRSMLALKSVLSKADQTPTLIFDEVDQGIGGRLGMVIGEKLWRLSLNHQVLVVTHLAQLASFADNHFSVNKYVSGKRTITSVQPLDSAERLQELTAMLGSEAESARQNANDLVTLAAEIKQSVRNGGKKTVESVTSARETQTSQQKLL